MLYDLTAMQSTMAGYFGGYSSKVQDMGMKELKQLREALERKVDGTTKKQVPKAFQEYSKRLLKDLEAKSMVRTAVETLNLSLAADNKDVLKAECFRTFPTVQFPAQNLLRLLEKETGSNKKKQPSHRSAYTQGLDRRAF